MDSTCHSLTAKGSPVWSAYTQLNIRITRVGSVYLTLFPWTNKFGFESRSNRTPLSMYQFLLCSLTYTECFYRLPNTTRDAECGGPDLTVRA